MAARRGYRVALFDRDARAQGATIRNFGMIWPIGQPAGELYEVAIRSREFWLELNEHGVVKADECGSVHLAHHDDEHAVLDELCSSASHDCRLLSKEETLEHAPIANPDGLRGGLYSPTELRVDPRTAASRIANWLEQEKSVIRVFQCPIGRVDGGVIYGSGGQQWRANRVIVCSGSDLHTLFPKTLQASGLKLCKLQMLRTEAQPRTTKQGAHIASGLTLRHYAAFSPCPTLAEVKKRVSKESPELDKFGIHVMATQADNGEMILGDSHEYGEDISPFDKPEIDELILRELKKIIHLPNWEVSERWHGIYSKHPSMPIFEAEPAPNVHVCLGPSGAGMTMSFGFANRAWINWEGPEK